MVKETPEEKLLKVIDGSTKPPILARRIGFKQKRFAFNLSFLNKTNLLKIGLDDINKIFFGISALLTLYLIYSLLETKKLSDVFYREGVKPFLINFKENKYLSQQEYLTVGRREIFFSSKEKTEKEKDKFLENLKLVGIIWSQEPEAMIENTQENRTYLLKKGDSILQENIKIKEIKQNFVVLEIADSEGKREWELR